MTAFSHIADLCRRIEYGYPRAVEDHRRDGILLAETKIDGEGLSEYRDDILHGFRSTRAALKDWREILVELGDLTFQHLPDVAVDLRIISHGCGTIQPAPDVESLVAELRVIGGAAIQAGTSVEVGTGAQPAEVGETRTWEDVLPEIDNYRRDGKKWPGYRRMKEILSCRSDAPIRNAIKNAPVEIQEWVCPPKKGESRLVAPPEAFDFARDTKPQQRELDPAEVIPDDDLDVLLRKLMDDPKISAKITPAERQEWLSRPRDEQRQLVEAYSRIRDEEREQKMRLKKRQNSRNY